jgi:CRP/FNR family transcriptional regulator, anaerobic regulatory protein
MYAISASSRAARPNPAAPPTFRGLERAAATRIAAIDPLQHVKAHQTLFSEGDPADHVYEVRRGTIKLYKLLPDGRRQVTGFLSVGHLLGLAHGRRYLCTAEAVTDAVLSRYQRARFERLVNEIPAFASRIFAITSDELRAAQDQMLLLGRKTADEKMASFLLMMAKRQGEDQDAVHIPMGRGDIADYLGLTTETVSRTFSKFRRERLIRLANPTRVELLDRAGLEQLAAGEAGKEL